MSGYEAIEIRNHDCRATDGAPRGEHTIIWKWKCPTCGQRWEGSSYAGGHYISATGTGQPSWRWRRANRRRFMLNGEVAA